MQQPQAVVAFQHDGQAGANQPVTSGGQMTPQGWDYKYPHLSCASICDPSDSRGLKLEALFQHVLGYPRLPARVYQFLPRIPSDISTMTTTVEGLSRRYGRELVLYFLRRYPNMLDFDLDTLVRMCSMHARMHYEGWQGHSIVVEAQVVAAAASML